MTQQGTGPFQQGIELFSRRQYAEAAACLAQAAQAGDAEAQNLLGVMLLNGMGITQSSNGALQLFIRAATSGLKEAHYNLANVLYNGLGVTRDPAQAQQHLLASARAGHRPALRCLGYLYHLAGSDDRWQELSTLCFRLAAEGGDPLAKYALGMRLAQGHGAPVDTAAAIRWFTAAAQDRVYLASVRLAEMRAKPASTSDAPGRQGGVEKLIPFTPAQLPEPRPSRGVAFLSEYVGALDPYLCDHLINVGLPSLERSDVVDPKTGRGMRSEVRTSYSMSFVASMYDPIVAEILRRIAVIAGSPEENAEPLGVLRYGVGQEYRPHFDFYDDVHHTGQRLSTVFVYLNDVAEGGGTEFPRLGVRVEPARGKAVKFFNCDAAGKPNPATLHAGLPVIHGEKWLATFWFWDRPFPWFVWAPDHESTSG